VANGKLSKLYALYQQRLRELNACDFGDLLLHQLTLLRENPDILEQYQNRFHYLLVDEYQDTNVAQYLWLRLLAQKHKNICVVGDEDQSIYGWRGAEIGNILRFEEDFPGAKVVRLEENYRSTAHILGAASGLIAATKCAWQNAVDASRPRRQSRNPHLMGRRGRSPLGRGRNRSLATARRVARRHRDHGSCGFQTRQFEERFIALGIPYRVLVARTIL
jgi:DNA helicase-2/ATP-dependent DNA helicase PcrA